MPKLSFLTDNKQGCWGEKRVNGSMQLRQQTITDKDTNTPANVNKQPCAAKTEAVHLQPLYWDPRSLTSVYLTSFNGP